ncbi:lysine biosynthesis protein LysW [Actinomadura sp. HBU206391]|uniref:lysine biosynthesis protein LysW n=1 Tax=Actinomadura sp. HBU206391 TaxID=2731692 RepID=UPI00164F84CB|nr:lysine biosynthesis protein LysW [Actinomadura sp. HBU206391]MBC6461401.1 lysine biosynthesis protein LysW [Actinomadura sp. HBU206391]
MNQTCPECEGTVQLAEPVRLSEIAQCSECSAELEVVNLDPVSLAPAPEIEEDWGE